MKENNTVKGLPKMDDEESYIPMSYDEARKIADSWIAKRNAERGPDGLYDELVRPDPQHIMQEQRRNRRRSYKADGDRDVEQQEEEGVRLATLAFFTLMALLGFVCTYVLVYVIDPMTRKEQDTMLKQTRTQPAFDL